MTAKLTNAQIAWRAAQDISDGAYVNLGIGFPEMVAKFKPEGREVIYHTENGILDFGEAPPAGQEDWDLINAGKEAIRLGRGAAFFHHADSFGMMRGGHLDFCVLGAFQVSANGDLANWHTGEEDSIPAVGGAMDLAIGAKRVFVMMDHLTKDGKSKLLPRCTYPLTGLGCVSRVYTDLATLEIREDGVFVIEIVDGQTPSTLQAATGIPLDFSLLDASQPA